MANNILVTVLLVLTISCSGEGVVSTDLEVGSHVGERSTAGHSLIGLYDVHVNIANGSVDAIPVRMVASHYDVTQWLIPPVCFDCFVIHLVGIDHDANQLTAEVTVKNFTKALTGYDILGIVYPLGDYQLLNAYAYTLLHAPSGVTDPSGFRAYKSGDPERDLGPEESATETYVISFPEGAGFIDLRYAIDASWPDHCPEAYDIYEYSQVPVDMVAGAEADVSVRVDDWQDDVDLVTINTDALGGGVVGLVQIPGDSWAGTITNEIGVPPGSYPALITAKDTVSLQHLFQWVEITVTDLSDTEPPTWDSDVGITGIDPGLGGVLVHFGTASDINGPVTYNLYWSDSDPMDFGTANKTAGIDCSPYLLTGFDPGVFFFCIRAEDSIGNETQNTDSTTSIVGAYPNVWWQDGPNMTVPRGYSGGFIDGGYFWVLGGSGYGTMYDTVERYDIAGGTWGSPWSLPEARDSFGCGTLGGKAYIFGGRYAETDVTDTCRIINLANGIIDMTSPTYPMALANMGCTEMDGTFYLGGGRHFSGSAWVYHREVFTYTPPGSEFVGETDLEYETSTMGFAAGDGYLMSAGGHPDREDVLYHVPETKSWNFKAILEPGREGNVCVWIDGWLYSMGGNNGTTMLNNVDVLDVAGDTWYTINSLNHERNVAVVDTDGEYIYIAGGLGPENVPTATFEIGIIY